MDREKNCANLFLGILLIILALVGWLQECSCFVVNLKKEFASNPRLNVEAVRTLFRCERPTSK